MARKKIVNEVSSTIYSLPWFVARDEGYFGDENLDVEFIKALVAFEVGSASTVD